ncbi:hypothetical protein RUM43_014329 [Polyplax serrata]|uniref:Pru domain-containing protein n=1 Tax=Polyplax serrata TaxID=468196 RepID=A0AAN8S9K3_POLSC
MPSSGALFGNAVARNQNKNLVEFKAGKMTMKGKMVHPDKRKDDSLIHFCWKDRVTRVVEDVSFRIMYHCAQELELKTSIRQFAIE